MPLSRTGWSADELLARVGAGRATPWVDPVPHGVVVPDGLPSSCGTVRDELAEGRLLYTFCWRDATAEQVLLWANRLTDETRPDETLMERVPGTDLWVACFVMPSDWRASYCLLPVAAGATAPWSTGDQAALRAVLDRGRRDPANPRTSTNRAGVAQSVVEGPAAPVTPWAAPAGLEPAGTLDRHGVAAREVWVHHPAGATDATPLPLLVVLDGETWIQHQHLPAWLEAGYEAGALPVHRTLFVASGGQAQRWRDLGHGGDGLEELCEVLVPWARRAYVTLPGPASVTVAGQSLGGLAALRAAVERPDVVGRAVSQSASLWQGGPEVESRNTAPSRSRVHLAHGAQEWVLAGPHRELVPALGEAGLQVRAVSHQGGHDYAWWRVALLDGLAWVHRPAGADGGPYG